MKILSIETSCDETAIALVNCKGTLRQAQGSKLRFEVLKNLVSSQIKIHRPFGGVVPMLAKREHIKNLPIVLKKIFEVRDDRNDRGVRSRKQSINPPIGGDRSSNIDLIAVTVGPGLEPALWTGIEFAKDLAKKLDKPLIGVNHMEGHLYSNWLPHAVIAIRQLAEKQSDLKGHPEQSEGSLKIATSDRGRIRNDKIKFPAIALVVSGGHTILLKMDSLTKWKKLGETRDDAAGEAFDKVARLLGLPYPGGPEIQKIAKKGNPKAINFPRPMLNVKNPVKSLRDNGASYDFSFSGLKTAVLYYVRGVRNDRDDRNVKTSNNPPSGGGRSSNIEPVANIAASFQQAVIDTLVGKTIRAAKNFGAESVLLCGGVSANRELRKQLEHQTSNIKLSFHVPDFEFNTDNAAMIAAAAYIRFMENKKPRTRESSLRGRLRLVAQSNLNL